MEITLDKIKVFRPCQDRLDNFTTHYPNYSGQHVDFLGLEQITYSDKVWVCARLMSQNQKFYWARACAWSVLDIFEGKYPDDKRVRTLLEYLNTIEDVTKLTEIQKYKIRDLRRAYAAADADATDAYAYAYAYAAAAAYAYAYAADADATDAYAYAAAYAYAYAYAAGRQEQQEFQLIILAEILELDI